jgi:DNA-binding CsgD family transcriptional regulator/tetratricopeptide (TPR) repeat protein
MGEQVSLAGRRSELARLSAVVGGADSLARTCVIVGEAGIGKTRLLEAGLAEAARNGTRMVAGACLPLAEGLPFMPVAELIRRLTELDGGGLLARLAAEHPRYVLDQVAGLVPEFADAVPPATLRSDSGQRLRLFSALREVIAVAAMPAPLCLSVEDVHWADMATLDFLSYLTGALPPGVAVVVTCRPDSAHLTDAARTWLRRMSSTARVCRIDLGPLDRDATAEQICMLMGPSVGMPALDSVFARSGGNPFFTEQLVLALQKHDFQAHGVRTKRSLEPAQLPVALTAVLEDRLHGVDVTERQVIAALAIAERPLDERALAAVNELKVRKVRTALIGLQDRGLVLPSGQHFDLKHKLVGEVVSAALLAGMRVELHAALARWLGEHGAGEDAAEVAEHWHSAERPAQELHWRLRAAVTAQQRFDSCAAAIQWTKALRLWDVVAEDERPAEISLEELYAHAEDATEDAGDWTPARLLAEQAWDRLGADADPARQVRLLRRVGRMRRRDDPMRGLAALRTAVQLAADLPISEDYLRALVDLATGLRLTGRFDDMRVELETGLRAVEQSGLTAAEPELLALLGWHYAVTGNDAGVLATYDRAWRLPQVHDDPKGLAVLSMWQTDVLLQMGRFQQVLGAGRAALYALAALGVGESFHGLMVTGNVATALIELGRTADAAELIDPLTDEEPSHDRFVPHQLRAALDLRRGDTSAALARWRQLDPIVARLSNPTHQLDICLLRTEVQLWTGRPAEAWRAAESVAAALASTDESVLTGPLLVLLAQAAADLAEPGSANHAGIESAGIGSARNRLLELHGTLKVDPFRAGPLRPAAVALRATWDAELTRLAHRSDPDAWSAATEQWDLLQRPHRSAYCRWRLGEALLTRSSRDPAARNRLRDAHRQAAGHEPLLRSVQLLATRARIGLSAAPAQPRYVPAPSAEFHLTARELGVLRLVAEGCTNAEIGRRLFISPSTVGVHVSGILRKLGASSRVQASAIAERSGLLRDSEVDLPPGP